MGREIIWVRRQTQFCFTYLHPHKVCLQILDKVTLCAPVERLIVCCVLLRHRLASKGEKAFLYISVLIVVCVLVETFNLC